MATMANGGAEKGAHHDSEDVTVRGSDDVVGDGQGKAATVDQDTSQYPGPLALALLMVGISAACFIVALDRTIVATAIPKITDEFTSPEDVGWYGSAYLLTSCAFQPTFGRVFAHFNLRWSFLFALFMFELGSLICGVAVSSRMLIVGRALAGWGCAGIFSGSMVVISHSVTLSKRPMFIALVGSIFGIGSVCGPLIGGAFTSNVTWRWCFYINLPVGAVTVICFILFFHPPKRAQAEGSFLSRFLRLDLLGNVLIITSITMLLLALQWGGETYAWNSSQIIGLLVGAGVEFIIFMGWQIYRGEDALIPPKMLVQRTVASSFGMSFFLSGTILVHSYYLPYWFQAVRFQTPVESGVDLLPYVLSIFVLSMISGSIVTKTGWFTPPAIIGPAIAFIGCGLLTTLQPDTSMGKWIGYQILTAGGVGIGYQQGIVATQAVLPPSMVSIGSNIIIFAQSLSGAIFVSVGNSILRNELSTSLAGAGFNGATINTILEAGATNVQGLVPASQLTSLINAYNFSLDRVFIMAVVLGGLGFLSTLPMQWLNLKSKDTAGNGPTTAKKLEGSDNV